MSELSDLKDEVREFNETVRDLKDRNLVVTAACAILTVIVAVVVVWVVMVLLPRIDRNAKTAGAAATRAQVAIDAATATEARLAARELARCTAGNDYRVADRARWQFILDLVPASTAEDRERRRRFVTFIDRADAIQDCTPRKAAPTVRVRPVTREFVIICAGGGIRTRNPG